MVVVTGGAGFIGSALVWRLNRRGVEDILVVDHLETDGKWSNLVGLRYTDYLDKEQFIARLENNGFGEQITAICHLGACSSTTEADAGYLMENNYHYSLRLASWREAHTACRLVYASSAATYGDGVQGYNDNEDGLGKLRPLNMYGYSKHLFDLAALRSGWLSKVAGLKYFNVFGPNEYHKGEMRSVVGKAFPTVSSRGVMRLFKSCRDDVADGEQQRDFIYIKDAVDMTLFFLDNPDANGIYNVGTGVARSWNDVAAALFQAMAKEGTIEYFDMPESLCDKYQYHTCANIGKLRAAGCTHVCMSLEESIADYVRNYLAPGRRLGTSAGGDP